MIELIHVTKTYNKGKKNEYTALRDVNLVITEGDFAAITGTSGAGKSTLLYVICGVDTYEGGSCKLDGVELGGLKDTELARLRNETFGFVMQDFALIEDFSVLENVMVPLHFSKKTAHKKALAMEALERVGIAELAGKRVLELSGGQKQRTAIARAIVNHPTYLLADEPTGALDSKTSAEIIGLFERLNREGQMVLIVTHDKNVAERCTRQIVVEDGHVYG